MSEAPTIDGVALVDRWVPGSLDDASQLIRQCQSEGHAVFPMGAGSALELGLPPSRSGIQIETRELAEIDDYPHEDLTITVQTGIRLDHLASVLAEKGQMFPVDSPCPRNATLGGLIATNTSGPRRFGYGTARDYILGIDILDAQGMRVHAGGRVVKNVAGYDLMKLHTGALGTLGIVVQVTLKLRPIPEARSAVVIFPDSTEVERVVQQVMRSGVRPVGLELVSRESAAQWEDSFWRGNAPWGLAILFEESREGVDWQLAEFERDRVRLRLSDSIVVRDDQYDALLGHLIESPWRSTCVVFKASLLNSKVAAFCQSATDQMTGVRLQAHAGNGIVWGGVDAGDRDTIAAALGELRRLANQCDGNLVVPNCPTAWKSAVGVWGTPRDDWRIMRALKDALDPTDLFNPGRFGPAVAAPGNADAMD